MTTETAPPPPYFGVSADDEPTVAHLFGAQNDWKSACGVPLRLMQNESEAELSSCLACVEIARVWAKN